MHIYFFPEIISSIWFQCNLVMMSSTGQLRYCVTIYFLKLIFFLPLNGIVYFHYKRLNSFWSPLINALPCFSFNPFLQCIQHTCNVCQRKLWESPQCFVFEHWRGVGETTLEKVSNGFIIICFLTASRCSIMLSMAQIQLMPWVVYNLKRKKCEETETKQLAYAHRAG